MQVVLGGTFDPVHDGHRKLFSRGLELGDLTVGLTSDGLAPQTRNVDRYVRPWEDRKRDLATELAALEEGRSPPSGSSNTPTESPPSRHSTC